ncbi:MAG: CapA family protein [Chitinophagaceae bacterium]|nr:CapA family protein [Chitinophagaceae bacterium]
MRAAQLPVTAKDIFKLQPKDWVIYNAAIWFYKTTGLWTYPVEASGDLETMTTMDKIYWLYKTVYPIRSAWKNAGLEDFFARQANSRPAIPDNFSIQQELSLAAAGDLMIHPYLVNSGATLYKDVQELIFGKDIAMANLECCISEEKNDTLLMRKHTGPALSCHPRAFAVLNNSGKRPYDFMSAACNHSLDLGVEGAFSTAAVLDEHGTAFHGLNFSPEDCFKATIIEKKHVNIGILCWTFGLNAKKPPADKPWLVNRLNLNDNSSQIDFSGIAKQIEFCRRHKADFIIAQLHWGYEHEFYPRPWQIETAHHLAELGIDLIIGHHPHVVQPVEYYRTQRDANRVVPIYYSLGNLVNPFSADHLIRSDVAEIVLAKGMINGEEKTYVKHAVATAVVQQADTGQQILRITI